MAAEHAAVAGLKRPSPSQPGDAFKKRKRYEEKPLRANRREERRELMAQAKTTWEQLRPKATSRQKSVSLVADLLKLLEGRVVEFVFRHDGSRIVQWMLAEGDELQKSALLAELMEGSRKPTLEGELPFFVKLAGDRYGHHLALKVIRVADKKNRAEIYDRHLKGNAAQLMRGAYGADVLDVAFQTVLKARQKARLVLELLYAREKKLLATVLAKMGGKEGEGDEVQAPLGFAQSLELLDENFRGMVIDSAGAMLTQLVDKENLLRFEIVHAALKDYFQVVMASCAKEKSQEMAVLLAPVLVHFAHTKAGIHVAVNCVKILDAKHRKKVLRALKTHIRKLLEDEYGHRLILALFEWVDDTRLVGKTVSTEMFSASSMAAELVDLPEAPKTSSRGGKKKAEKKGRGAKDKKQAEDASGDVDMAYMQTMCRHRYARVPVLSLYFGRDTRYFNPDVYRLVWSDIDTDKFGQLSKKDAEVRRSELRMMFDAAMGDVMRGHLAELLKSHWSAPMVIGTLLNAETRQAVTAGLIACLQSETTLKELVADTCARKTIGTMFKVGGKAVACQVLDECSTSLVRVLAEAEGCRVVADHLVKASERADAERALEAALASQ